MRADNQFRVICFCLLKTYLLGKSKRHALPRCLSGFGKREHLKTTLHRLKTDPAPAPTLALTPAPGVSVHSGRDEGTEQLRGTVRLLGWTCLYYVLGV